MSIIICIAVCTVVFHKLGKVSTKFRVNSFEICLAKKIKEIRIVLIAIYLRNLSHCIVYSQ